MQDKVCDARRLSPSTTLLCAGSPSGEDFTTVCPGRRVLWPAPGYWRLETLVPAPPPPPPPTCEGGRNEKNKFQRGKKQQDRRANWAAALEYNSSCSAQRVGVFLSAAPPRRRGARGARRGGAALSGALRGRSRPAGGTDVSAEARRRRVSLVLQLASTNFHGLRIFFVFVFRWLFPSPLASAQ